MATCSETCDANDTFTAEHEPAAEPTDLPPGAGVNVIHVPEDPDGIVLQDRRTYQDPQKRVEAALLVAAKVMVELERDVYRRVAAEYRAVNNYVSETAILELVQAELYDRREAADAR